MDNREASFDVDGIEMGTVESLEQARQRVRRRLASRDPIVHKAVQLWQHGIVSWEEALILMVEGMEKTGRSLMDMVARNWKVSVSPLRIPGSGDDLVELLAEVCGEREGAYPPMVLLRQVYDVAKEAAAVGFRNGDWRETLRSLLLLAGEMQGSG